MSESYIKSSSFTYCGTCKADRMHIDTGQRRAGKAVMLCTKCYRRSLVVREGRRVERTVGHSEGVTAG